MQIIESINYTYSDKIYQIIRTLNSIESDTIACDFETASRWEDSEKDVIKTYLEEHSDLDLEDRRVLAQYVDSTGLSHPSLTYITHLSVAWSPTDAFVAILPTDQHRRAVLRWLISTEKKQIWHNYSFDGKLIYYHTGKFVKNFEDTEILSKTLLNHTNTLEAKSGLKHLMGYKYGEWAVSKDNFNLSNLYDEELIKYAGIDACATYALWEELNEATGERVQLDIQNPIDLLPLPEPRNSDYPDGWFYEQVAKPLIKDTIRIMYNGLPIDLDKVKDLEVELDSILEGVQNTVNSNKYIQEFQKFKYPQVAAELKSEIESKMRPPEYYLKEFKPDHMTYRSYFMQVFIERHAEDFYDVVTPLEEVAPGVPKWTVRDVKPYVDRFHELKQLIAKTISPNAPNALEAMRRFAADKSEVWNRSYLTQIADIKFSTVMTDFNPGSSKQLREFFDWLGVEPIEFSKDTGEPSWGREQIEELHRSEKDPDLIELYQAFIDRSFAAIVRQNFINAFFNYSVEHEDGVHYLHGNYRLLGAKTGRYTSDKPNMLNTPSTGSIYSKPIKRCFIAPPEFIVAGIDYAALEDRVVANITQDDNKLGLFLEGLDGHSLSATYYYPDRVKALIGDFTDNKEASKKLKALVDSGNKEAKSVRQDAKPISFGLAYGAYPKKVASQVKIPIEEAQAIFDAYHNEMYPSITDFRENYVLPTASSEGRIHMGMGYYLRTDNADKAIRTLNNSQAQFWSTLTALTINKLHTAIDEAGYQDDIIITSTIYDSIYFIVREDPVIIKWLNDTIVPIMETDFIINQTVSNSADLEIGLDWSDIRTLSHNASLEEITRLLKELHGSNT